MTGPEHYREAERLLDEFGQEVEVPDEAAAFVVAVMHGAMARAQVHATLALAAATALKGNEESGLPRRDWDDWDRAAGVKPVEAEEPQP